MTITEIKRQEVRNDIFNILEGRVDAEVFEKNNEDNGEEIDIEFKLREDIKKEILNLSSEEMEKFLAGVFRAMGFKTKIRGLHTQADGGYDITVSKDGLGLGSDTILVEVKHRPNTKMTSQEVRSFDSVINNKKRNGIYFSSGGFTADALKELKNSQLLTFLDLDGLVDLVFEYYDNFDSKMISLLPLKKVYILDK
jgi:restriction system protein